MVTKENTIINTIIWRNDKLYMCLLVVCQQSGRKLEGNKKIMENNLDLDEIDRTILRHLRQDARMSLQEMSRQTGISDATIQFRLKRMKAHGVIERFTIATNPVATGYNVTAIMLMQTDSEKHDQAAAALVQIPEITEVVAV